MLYQGDAINHARRADLSSFALESTSFLIVVALLVALMVP